MEHSTLKKVMTNLMSSQKEPKKVKTGDGPVIEIVGYTPKETEPEMCEDCGQATCGCSTDDDYDNYPPMLRKMVKNKIMKGVTNGS